MVKSDQPTEAVGFPYPIKTDIQPIKSLGIVRKVRLRVEKAFAFTFEYTHAARI
jgi:hypothetical protein